MTELVRGTGVGIGAEGLVVRKEEIEREGLAVRKGREGLPAGTGGTRRGGPIAGREAGGPTAERRTIELLVMMVIGKDSHTAEAGRQGHTVRRIIQIVNDRQ